MTAIILSGGENSRMFRDKAFLRVGQKTIIAREIEVLSALFPRVMIVTNTPDRYAHLGAELIPDEVVGKGPLGGIYSGLLASKDDHNFIVSCDLPFFSSDLISYMSRIVDGYDAVVPKFNGFVEPLHAVYSKRCIIPVKNQLDLNQLKIQSFFDKVRIRYIGKDDINRYDPEGTAFFNINTEDDLKKARLIAED